jgi:HPt (histidine-containing phosphotransfer) domain-containing protein
LIYRLNQSLKAIFLTEIALMFDEKVIFDDSIKTMSETKHTDLSYLRNLTGGATDKMAKYIRMFLTGAPISIQQMELHLLSNDYSGVKQAAHALKPQLGYFGAKRSEEIVREIERISGDLVDLDRLPGHLEAFKTQYAFISVELDAALKELGN